MGWWIVHWEMRVRADSKDEAEAMAQRFAQAADQLNAEGKYDDFDTRSLTHVEPTESFQQALEARLPITVDRNTVERLNLPPQS